MQMAAVRRLGRKQGLEEAYAGCHDTGRIPTLTEQSGPLIQLSIAVNLQKIRHYLPVILHILLNDGEKRQNQNNPTLSINPAVFRRKCKETQGLSQAGGGGEGKQPRLLGRSSKAIVKQLISHSIEGACCSGSLLFLYLHLGQTLKGFLRVQLRPLVLEQIVWLLMFRSAGIIRIHQGRKQKPRPQHPRQRCIFPVGKLRQGWRQPGRRKRALPLGYGIPEFLLAKKRKSAPFRIQPIALSPENPLQHPVIHEGKLAMMRRNHRGEKLCRPVLSLTSVAPPAVGLKNKCRSRACMIHMSFLPAQHLLKILAVFSKIVKFP